MMGDWGIGDLGLDWVDRVEYRGWERISRKYGAKVKVRATNQDRAYITLDCSRLHLVMMVPLYQIIA